MKNKISSGIVLRNIRSTADAIVFSAILSASVLRLSGGRFETVGFILMTIGISAFVLLLKKASEKKRKLAKQREEETERMTDQILLLDDTAIAEMTGEKAFCLIRRMKPDRYDILNAIRRGADAIGLLSDDREARQLVERYAPGTKIYNIQMLCSHIFGSDGELVKEKDRRTFFGTRLFNKYFQLGCLLLVISMFARYKIYYRLFSGLCMILAALTGFFPNSFLRKNLRIFLDKRGDR